MKFTKSVLAAGQSVNSSFPADWLAQLGQPDFCQETTWLIFFFEIIFTNIKQERAKAVILGEYSILLPFTVRCKRRWAFFPTDLSDGRQVWLEEFYDVEYWQPAWFRQSVLDWKARDIILNEPCEGHWEFYNRVLPSENNFGTDVLKNQFTGLVSRVLHAITEPGAVVIGIKQA